MFEQVFIGIFLIKFVLVLTKETELPLCPTNVLYFPQNLPMHCRLPTNADFPGISGPLPTPTQFIQGSSSDKHILPVPIPNPPGAPGPVPMSGPLTMSGPIPLPGPMAIPGPPASLPFPGPIPLSAGPAHKLPVIVMPFYSPDTSFKNTEKPNYPQYSFRPRKWKIKHRRRKPPIYSSPDTSSGTDTETSVEPSSSSSSEYQGWWKGRRNYRRFSGPIRMKKRKRYQKRQILTPVLQYVTKDGYVIFEKKLSKNEAKDWLYENIEITTRVTPETKDTESDEPNDNHTAEKEMITEENIEAITKSNTHRLNKIQAHRAKIARKKL